MSVSLLAHQGLVLKKRKRPNKDFLGQGLIHHYKERNTKVKYLGPIWCNEKVTSLRLSGFEEARAGSSIFQSGILTREMSQ